jgi:hypothetical protein
MLAVDFNLCIPHSVAIKCILYLKHRKDKEFESIKRCKMDILKISS